jgi:hypothetical protein
VGLVRLAVQLVLQVQIIPADDDVLDEPPAGFGDLLVLLFALNEFLVVAVRDGPGEFV